MWEEGLGQILRAQAWWQGREGGGHRARSGAESYLGEPAQALPSPLQSLCPCPGAEKRRERAGKGPPTHIGEPPCSSPAGDKGIIVRPTDTPLSN